MHEALRAKSQSSRGHGLSVETMAMVESYNLSKDLDNERLGGGGGSPLNAKVK